MRKRIIGIMTCLAMVVMLTSCGNDNTTQEPAATENVSETTAENETPTPEATEGSDSESTEAPEPTEEPEATAEPEATEEPGGDINFDVNKLKNVLKKCIGIGGTAGASLKWAVAADKCLGYAVKNKLSKLDLVDSVSFSQAMDEAVNSFSQEERDSLNTEMSENIMPMITDSFQEQGLYDGELEDAGVLDSWNRYMAKPTVQDDWSVFWIAYETSAEQ
ncbi:MAG: hypothetical protein J5819_08220 [Eubacterium sp.]|nr:hypothetical protein [Eubacterium sp.]